MCLKRELIIEVAALTNPETFLVIRKNCFIVTI